MSLIKQQWILFKTSLIAATNRCLFLLLLYVDCVCAGRWSGAVVVPVPLLFHLSCSWYSASLTANVARPSRPTYICVRHLGNVTIARFLAKLKSRQYGAPVRRSEHCQKGLQTFKWLYVLSAHAQLRIMENKTIQSLINNQNKANI